MAIRFYQIGISDDLALIHAIVDTNRLLNEPHDVTEMEEKSFTRRGSERIRADDRGPGDN
jgi:hypothetical protein